MSIIYIIMGSGASKRSEAKVVPIIIHTFNVTKSEYIVNNTIIDIKNVSMLNKSFDTFHPSLQDISERKWLVNDIVVQIIVSDELCEPVATVLCCESLQVSESKKFKASANYSKNAYGDFIIDSITVCDNASNIDKTYYIINFNCVSSHTEHYKPYNSDEQYNFSNEFEAMS